MNGIAAKWEDAAVKSMIEISTSALGSDEPEVMAHRDGLPQGLTGACVAMVGDESLQVGVFSDPSGCESMARALLGMAPEDAIDAGDVADALGEIANMLAGAMKRHAGPTGAAMKLGLPVYIEGRIVERKRVAAVTTICVGSVKAEVLVICAPGD